MTKISSMTGYACLDFSLSEETRCRLHMKSVNHRFFEMRWRAPRNLAPLETWMRQEASSLLKRGSLDFWIETDEEKEPENRGSLRVKNFLSRLDEVSAEGRRSFLGFRIPAPLKSLILSRHVDLWWAPEKSEPKVDEKLTKIALQKLLLELKKCRLEEGAALQKVLLEQVGALEKLLREITGKVPALRTKLEEDYRLRMEKIKTAMGASIAEERLMQEMLILAEKRDVAEECSRIDIHLKKLSEVLESETEQTGKRLDFLSQELHREWTTLGNKLQNAECSQIVIEAKLSIEKIREQSLNVA